MNQKEFKKISEFLSPNIAKKLKALEEEIDKHFMVTKNIKKSDYKTYKNIIWKIIIDATPELMRKAMNKIAEHDMIAHRRKSTKHKKK